MNNKEINFEKVNTINFNEFFNLINKLAEYEKQKILDEKIKNRLKSDICSKKPIIEAYLTFFNEKCVGYFIYFFNYSSYQARPVLFIEDIFLLEEYRRKGIGKKMFNFCIQKAKEKKCGRIEWCVYNWNTPAIKFYDKLNATKLDKSYYRLVQEQFNE